ncbi:hypothetical protein ADIS_4326 [Lunatimonas lonarensis]|uniref:Uncharacterized protein n=1 Tax=Lunatimonas lonarensis TaxID=1232681 RepID=R7ZM33_9BACT|nr:hypothetical protein ADIS_4326 [Lunatimonas lonarensis]
MRSPTRYTVYSDIPPHRRINERVISVYDFIFSINFWGIIFPFYWRD